MSDADVAETGRFTILKGGFGNTHFANPVRQAPRIIKVIESINFNDYESTTYFQKVLRNSGIIEALEEKGIKDGDTVSIYDVEFDYYK